MNEDKKTRYIVTIDNGVNYCADLPEVFNTEEEAEMAAKDWLQSFYEANDIDPQDQEDDEAGYDIHEIAVIDEKSLSVTL